MKRILILMLVVSMILTLTVGCNSNENASENNVGSTNNSTVATGNDDSSEDGKRLSGTITVITNRTDLLKEDAAISMMDYAAEFNKIYPDVVVEFEGLTDYEGQIKIRMNTKEYGDVLMIPRENLTKEQLPDFFAPLGSLEEYQDKYLWITDKEYDGTVYGISVVGNAQGIVYNKDVFKAAGVETLPTSPEEFLKALQMVKDNTDAIPYYTNYAAGWPLGGQWETQALSIAGDGDWQSSLAHQDAPWAEGEPYYVLAKTLNDIVALGLNEEDPTTTDWEGSKGMIARGEIATMVLGSWSIVQMQEAAANEGLDPSVIGYMPFPYTNADGNIYAASGGDYNLGVNVHSDNKDAAEAWVKWFIDESTFTLDQGGISPIIGSEMPETLSGFADLGVIFVSNNPTPVGEETYVDAIDTESEVGRWSEKYRMRIIESAIGNTDESFEDIMDDLNARWKAAREELEIE